MALCCMCPAEVSKYKCATCRAPSCCLPCFKIHAAQCTAGFPQPKPSTTEPTSGAVDVSTRSESLKEQSHRPSSAELEDLFKRHPTLRTQLQDLYRLTQRLEERTEDNDSSRGRYSGRGRGRGSFAPNGAGDARHLTSDKAFDRGLKQLQRDLDQETGQGEALRAFAALILNTTKIRQPENDAAVLRP